MTKNYRPSTFEFAVMSYLAYCSDGRSRIREVPDGWQRSPVKNTRFMGTPQQELESFAYLASLDYLIFTNKEMGAAVISIKGTESVGDIVIDYDYVMGNPNKVLSLLNHLLEVAQTLPSQYKKVYVTGHSLGGIIAKLLTLYKPKDGLSNPISFCQAFESPGCRAFVEKNSESFDCAGHNKKILNFFVEGSVITGNNSLIKVVQLFTKLSFDLWRFFGESYIVTLPKEVIQNKIDKNKDENEAAVKLICDLLSQKKKMVLNQKAVDGLQALGSYSINYSSQQISNQAQSLPTSVGSFGYCFGDSWLVSSAALSVSNLVSRSTFIELQKSIVKQKILHSIENMLLIFDVDSILPNCQFKKIDCVELIRENIDDLKEAKEKIKIELSKIVDVNSNNLADLNSKIEALCLQNKKFTNLNKEEQDGNHYALEIGLDDRKKDSFLVLKEYFEEIIKEGENFDRTDSYEALKNKLENLRNSYTNKVDVKLDVKLKDNKSALFNQRKDGSVIGIGKIPTIVALGACVIFLNKTGYLDVGSMLLLLVVAAASFKMFFFNTTTELQDSTNHTSVSNSL